jgi:hypothetical protein
MTLRPISQVQAEGKYLKLFFYSFLFILFLLYLEEKVVAAYDYIAQAPDELNLTKGDIVVVLEKEEGWWKGELNGRVGVFPANVIIIFFTILLFYLTILVCK